MLCQYYQVRITGGGRSVRVELEDKRKRKILGVNKLYTLSKRNLTKLTHEDNEQKVNISFVFVLTKLNNVFFLGDI